MWLAILACTDLPPQGDDTQTSSPSVSTTPTVDVRRWRACDRVPGTGDGGAECATVFVPLDWEVPDGEQTELAVKRIPARERARRHLWIVHGGPSASAVDDLDLLSYGIPELRDDVEVYAVDHRGIGGSMRLGCPEETWGTVADEDWPACIAAMVDEWGPSLDHVTSSASARDLGALIDELRGDAEVFVWGGSYGTYLVQRWLHFFPDQADGVVIEGIQHPARDFVGFDTDLDGVVEDIFALCAADVDCAAHFAGDPWTTAEVVVDAVEEGHCAALGATADEVRLILGYLPYYFPLRDLVPAVVHRLERCGADDVVVLDNLWGALVGLSMEGNTGAGDSGLLFFHVALSEMWHAPEDAPSVEETEATVDALTATLALEVGLAARLPEWPRYPADAWDDLVPAYEGPLLMLQGGIDPATPWEQAEALTDDFDGPTQTWALFPYASHGVVYGSPTPGGDDCALDVYLQFLDAPGTPPDLTCIADVPPPDFDGDPGYTAWLFGTSDAWGDGGVSAASPVPPPLPRIPPPAFRRELEHQRD